MTVHVFETERIFYATGGGVTRGKPLDRSNFSCMVTLETLRNRSHVS